MLELGHKTREMVSSSAVLLHVTSSAGVGAGGTALCISMKELYV